MHRFVRVAIYEPFSWGGEMESSPGLTQATVLVADLDQRIVKVEGQPELGEFDLDSVIRMADTLRMALDARRNGVLEIPRTYGPMDAHVLRWLHEYFHRAGLPRDKSE